MPSRVAETGPTSEQSQKSYHVEDSLHYSEDNESTPISHQPCYPKRTNLSPNHGASKYLKDNAPLPSPILGTTSHLHSKATKDPKVPQYQHQNTNIPISIPSCSVQSESTSSFPIYESSNSLSIIISKPQHTL